MKKFFGIIFLALATIGILTLESKADIIVSFEFGGEGQGSTIFIPPEAESTGDQYALTWVPLVYMSVENTGNTEENFTLWSVLPEATGNLISMWESSYFPFLTQKLLNPMEIFVTPIGQFAGAFIDLTGFHPAQPGEYVELTGIDVEYSIGDDFSTKHALLYADENEFLRRGEVIGGTAPVPEPATMILFSTGLVGLFGVSRKKKK